jgi:arabinogalactan endo-1,4-beta-galactosidase
MPCTSHFSASFPLIVFAIKLSFIHSLAISIHFLILYGQHTSACPVSTPPILNSTAVQNQAFWAGADIGTTLRMEAIPGHSFYDFDGMTKKDPIQTLAHAGVNAIRVEARSGQCLGPSECNNAGDIIGKDLNFRFNYGTVSTTRSKRFVRQ